MRERRDNHQRNEAASTMTQDELFKEIRRLAKAGQVADSSRLLRDALRRGLLDFEGIGRAGRILRTRWLEGVDEGARPLRVLLLGQFTTSWLVPALTAVAWGRGVAAIVSEGGYDTVLQ